LQRKGLGQRIGIAPQTRACRASSFRLGRSVQGDGATIKRCHPFFLRVRCQSEPVDDLKPCQDIAVRRHRLHVPNQVLAAGSGGPIALVRPLLVIFFVSFSICYSHFLIRWRRQRFKIDVALSPQQHHALGDFCPQLLGRRIGADAVQSVGLVDMLHCAQPRMPVRCRQRSRIKIGAVGLILAAKRKRVGLAKGAQGLTVDQDRIVGQARVATHRRAAEAFHLTPARQTDQWGHSSTALQFVKHRRDGWPR
jgi:hypothetical protein